MHKLSSLKVEITIAHLMCLFSVSLLIYRVAITERVIFLFLIWNLFLAWIPFVLAVLIKRNKENRILVAIFLIGFIAFLPNSSYIVTDLIHITSSPEKLVWFDLIMITAFALAGLMLYFSSIKILLRSFNLDTAKYYLCYFLIILISSYGVFIGRFLRFNSWDILAQPLDLVTGSIDALSNLNTHLFSLAFTALLSILMVYIDGITLRSSKKV